jgi:hypothetical protein
VIEVAPAPSSIQACLARAAQRLEANEPLAGPPEGVAVAATLSVARLRAAPVGALDEAVEVAAALTGASDRKLLATWISGWVVHWVLGPALVTWLDERRVPPLDDDTVAVWWAGADGAFVCLGTGRWAVLSGDALAHDPDVDSVADEAALAALFHDRIVALLEPIFAAFHSAGRVGSRQQWLQARDRIALILQEAAAAAGREKAGVAAARALIERPGSPLSAPRGGFESYRVAPRQLTVVYHRATCCLALRGTDGISCLACPARPASATREAVLATLVVPGSATA